MMPRSRASAHSALTVIVEDGKEVKILRDNMPFGQPGRGEFGTYFIGYCRTPRITELMLENMFVGRPPGNYDRLLDFSRAVTGGLFFAPSATFLDGVGEEEPAAAAIATPSVESDPSSRHQLSAIHHLELDHLEENDMNNLHRELAPISDAAWEQIEEETTRTLKRYLAGRRVVDVPTPGGVGFASSCYRSFAGD